MNLNQYNQVRRIARTQAIVCTLLTLTVLWFLGFMLNEPMKFWQGECMANYWTEPETTIMPDPGLVHIVPEFEGVELIVDTPSIVHANEYGDVSLYVNTCWLTDFIGAPGLPNPLLDGANHTDTVASVVNIGDLVRGTVAGWDDLAIGAPADVLTVAAGLPSWAAPVVQTSNLLDNGVHADTITSAETLGDLVIGTGAGWDDLPIGAAGNVLTVVGGTAAWAAGGGVAAHAILDGVVHTDSVASAVTRGDVIIGTAAGWDDLPVGTIGQILYTADGVDVSWGIPHGVVQDMPETIIIVAGAEYVQALAVPAYNVTNASDVQCWVRYRVKNSQTIFNAISAPNPVAGMVRYYWVDEQGVGLSVHICNDSQYEIYATVSFVEPY